LPPLNDVLDDTSAGKSKSLLEKNVPDTLLGKILFNISKSPSSDAGVFFIRMEDHSGSNPSWRRDGRPLSSFPRGLFIPSPSAGREHHNYELLMDEREGGERKSFQIVLAFWR